jgi:ATP-dependent DNA helicase RecG
MQLTFQTSVEYLKGVGPNKAALLQKELQIYTIADLIQYYPFRYEDRSHIQSIKDLREDAQQVQLRGTLHPPQVTGGKNKKRLEADFQDKTGVIRLVWFQKISNIAKQLQPGIIYQLYGKLSIYNGIHTIIHPEMELYNPQKEQQETIIPVYHTTEKLKKAHVDSRFLRRIQQNLLDQLPKHIPEALPDYIRTRYQLLDKRTALIHIHFPQSAEMLQKALLSLKFEELFYIQLRLLQARQLRLEKQAGKVYRDTQLLHQFYESSLPFPLTDAQKRVVKEIYTDLRSGKQMNRLLQGDVGSGKTMVAFLAILLVLGSGNQAAMMAPTEILAEQHYNKLVEFATNLPLRIELLTGSTPVSERKRILSALAQGDIHILVGTHSLLNDEVLFKNLGLTIIDEQHRFGVMQRAKLWQRDTPSLLPHVLIMSATPIPRTLAMTLYGDLDISTIDEMPAGRKPVKTAHYYDAQRLRVFGFIKKQIEQGKQVYIIYPLIEDSDKTDYKSLMDGYESICRAFPETPISILHGKMKPADKDYEMQRFAKGETKIMVATTVIEVGINVPNATVMLIENADHFGLSQLHQLRGRVGRGQDQAYCILMTDYQISTKSRERIQALVSTNNGFEIADMDLRLRGPGDLMGIQQSGALHLKIADLRQDHAILYIAREAAKQVIQEDPLLEKSQHLVLKNQLASKNYTNWGNIG